MVFASDVPVNPHMCMVAGCYEPARAKGLCRRHYDRDRYAGNPEKPAMQRVCPVGHWFEPKRVDQVFCSDRHRFLYRRLSEKDPVRYPPRPRPKLFQSQRVRPEDVEPPIRVEVFTDSQVVAKCDGVCQACGSPVDLDSSGPDGPAFMWKVPLEKCREATLRNRLLVHERCRGGTP